MGFFGRSDGKPVRSLSPLQRIFPYVMRGRNQSAVHFSMQVDIDNVLSYLERVNTRLGSRRVRLFHVFVCAAVRMLALRPQLNRFVIGRTIYQRDKIQVSFIVKKELTEEAAETNVKITFEPSDTLMTVAEKVDEHIANARSRRKSADERTIDLVTRLPSFMIRFVTWAFRVLDYFGLAPRSMIEEDPLYTSMYLANLGSIGLDAPFHHLYEWGTASIFVAIGEIHKVPLVSETGKIEIRNVVNLNVTLDERIADGIYYAKSIELLKSLVMSPELLEEPPAPSSQKGQGLG